MSSKSFLASVIYQNGDCDKELWGAEQIDEIVDELCVQADVSLASFYVLDPNGPPEQLNGSYRLVAQFDGATETARFPIEWNEGIQVNCPIIEAIGLGYMQIEFGLPIEARYIAANGTSDLIVFAPKAAKAIVAELKRLTA